MSTISSVAIHCLKQLKAIAFSRDLQLYSAEIPQALWQDELGRLRVWAANIGAHQTGQASLDHRLRDASHIKEQTLRVLRRLQRLIQDLQDEVRPGSGSEDLSDSEDEQSGKSEVQMIYQDLQETIGNLFQLSMIIRKPAQHDRLRGTKRSDAAGFEPFDRQHVIDKYPQTEASVSERLGLAISQRRAILRYRERHHLKLGKGLGKAIEDQSDAVSTNISDTIATQFVEQPLTNVEFDSQSFVSQTSYAQTLLSGEEGLVLPPPPAGSEDGALFECPYCFVIISISGENAWARHVFNDLMPYICVFSDCPTPHRLYESRREWYFHLQTQHSLPSVSGGHVNCPLCSSSVATGKPFEKHVARHLEELALFALPRSQPEVKSFLADHESIKKYRDSVDSDSSNGSLYRVHQYTNEQSQFSAETLRASDTQGAGVDTSYEGDTHPYEDQENTEGLYLDQSNDSDQPLPEATRNANVGDAWFTISFAIYCTNCQPHSLIEKGTRLVAKMPELIDRKDLSAFSFYVQHAKCRGWIEIWSHRRGSLRGRTSQVVSGGYALIDETSVEQPSRGSETERSQLPEMDNGQGVSSGRPELSTRKVKYTKPMEFTDPTGRKFEFPLEQCSTWQGLQDTIRNNLRYAPDMLAQLEAGKYDIIDDAGSVIFPDGWNAIFGPGIRITMRIWPSRQYAIESQLEEGKASQLPEHAPTISSFLEIAKRINPNISRDELSRLADPRFDVSDWTAALSNMADKGLPSSVSGWIAMDGTSVKSKARHDEDPHLSIDPSQRISIDQEDLSQGHVIRDRLEMESPENIF